MVQSGGGANGPLPNERPGNIEEDELSVNSGQEDEAQRAVWRQRNAECQEHRRQAEQR